MNLSSVDPEQWEALHARPHWTLYVARFPSHPEWITVRLIHAMVKRRKGVRKSIWLSWNRKELRFSRGSKFLHMSSHYPQILAWAKSKMEGST